MKDLEFHVAVEGMPGTEKYLTDFDQACAYAVSRSVSTGQNVVIDVITWTRGGAKKWGGDAAVEIYNEDPDSSVHERIVIKAKSQGPVR
jgi:hypothetical protein